MRPYAMLLFSKDRRPIDRRNLLKMQADIQQGVLGSTSSKPVNTVSTDISLYWPVYCQSVVFPELLDVDQRDLQLGPCTALCRNCPPDGGVEVRHARS